MKKYFFYLTTTAIVMATFLVACSKDDSANRVKSVTMNKTSLHLYKGVSEMLFPFFSPMEATNKRVTWSSSDTNVATVDDQGRVTAVNTGTAIITVTTVDGNKTAECTVTVDAKSIVIGSQNVVSGGGGSTLFSSTYSVTTANIGTREELQDVTFYTSAAGTTTSNGPQGLIVVLTTGSSIRTLQFVFLFEAAPLNTYYFSITIDGARSNVATLSITR